MIYMYVSLHVRFVTDCLRKYIVLIRLAIYEIDQPSIFRYITSDKPNKCFFFEDQILIHIQEVMIKILNEITHRSYVSDMNFHQYEGKRIYWLIGHQVMSLTCWGSRRHNRDRSNLGCIDKYHALCTWLHSCRD